MALQQIRQDISNKSQTLLNKIPVFGVLTIGNTGNDKSRVTP